MNARYFDPVSGQFLQPDWFEVTEAGVGTNRYAYSGNDPVNLRDPSGNSYLRLANPVANFLEKGQRLVQRHGLINGLSRLMSRNSRAVPNSNSTNVNSVTDSPGPRADESGVVNVVSGIQDIEAIFGPGEDISNPGAREPNTGRGRPYQDALNGIKSLPGAKPVGEFETEWGQGEVITLPDGTKIIARPGSKSGGPTIEVIDSEGDKEKNRFPEEAGEEEEIDD